MLPRNTAAGLLVGAAAGAGAGYLLFGTDRTDENDPAALAARRRRRLLSLPLAPGAAASNHPALALGCPPADALREFPGFAVGWDARLRVPRWVAERITRETSRGDGDRSMHVFREDDGSGSGSGSGGGRRSRRRGGGRNNGGNNGNGAATAVSVPAGNGDPDDLGLDPRWRSTNEHYLASGYDRGHCAPAADFKGDARALEATFVLSNVAPQVGPGMNRDYWARFERFVKTLASPAAATAGKEEGESGGEEGVEREVVVFTGPLYLPRRVKPERGAPPNAPRYEMRHPMLGDPPRLVAVPTHFWKVALVLEKEKKNKGKKSNDGGGVGSGGDGGKNRVEGGGARAKALGAWVMPNAAIPPETPLTAFCVPLSALEDAAGGRFFQGVVDEEGGGETSSWFANSSSSSSSSAAAERLDAAALRWQARGRAAALELASKKKDRKSVSATAEAAAALLPLAPKPAGLPKGAEEGGGGADANDANDDDGGKRPDPAAAASPRASSSGAPELLLNPLPSRREQQQQQAAGRGSSSSSRPLPAPPPPEPAPKLSWLFRNAAAGRGGGGGKIAHICDFTECKLPAEDWYKSFPAGGGGSGGDKGQPAKK